MKRLTTGISELDRVLGGGLPSGRLIVVAGSPGTGKTILAQQICWAAATRERKAIYYSTFSAPHVKLVGDLDQFDFFDAEALGDRVELISLESMLLGTDSEDGDGLGALIAEVVRVCFEQRPAVLVIDSAKALRDFADERAVRRVFYELSGQIINTETTLLFIGEYTPDELASSSELSLADGIIQLAYEEHEPVDRRWLRVVKLRGSNPLPGKHPLAVGSSGIEIFPRTESLTPAAVTLDGARLATGIPGLDEMLGGGIPAGDVTALLGPSGSGKTTTALRFIAEGIEEGERCLYVSFQEDAAQLLKKADGYGWKLAAALEEGGLLFHHVPEGNLNLDMLGSAIRAATADGSVRRVVIDSLAELVLAARESERFPAYARVLTGFLRAAGATSLITSETATLGPMTEPLGGLSFLFHNVIQFRYIEMDSEVRRAVAVLKMRDSDHEKGLRQFAVREGGIAIGDKLEGLSGLLGWSALRDTSPLGL